MKKQGKIIVQPTDGLANRMRVLAFCKKVAEECDSDMLCIWTMDGTLNSPFESLFNNPGFPVQNVCGNQYQLWKYRRWWRNTCAWYWLVKYHVNVWMPRNVVDTMLQKGAEDELMAFKNKIVNALRNGDTIYFATGSYMGDYHDISFLTPVYDIMKEVTKSVSLFETDHSYGLHIRRTDNTWAIEHSPIELFERKIEDIISNDSKAKFYLATDDAKTAEYLCNRYGERIVYREKELSRTTENGIREAVIDMWILGNMDVIYGSYYSSFSSLASWINNKPLICVCNEGASE